MKNTIWYTEDSINDGTISWSYKAANDTGEVLHNEYDFSKLDFSYIEEEHLRTTKEYLNKVKVTGVVDYETFKMATSLLKHLESVKNSI